MGGGGGEEERLLLCRVLLHRCHHRLPSWLLPPHPRSFSPPMASGVSVPAPPVPDLPPPGQRGHPLRHPRGHLLPALGPPLHHCASSPLIRPSSRCKTSTGRQCGRQHTYSCPSLGRPHRSLFSVFPRPLPSKALSGLASADGAGTDSCPCCVPLLQAH